MVNFWISLYVTFVIVLAGSSIDGVQISRIGSQDDEIRTQDQDANLPTEPLLDFQAAPDEQ